jgi:alkylhydroperoxidase/carboxymuconolactone decarboxylase family protein YurZ
MGVPTPLTREQAPDALKTLVPFYDAVMSRGVIDARYKELAYLKTSSINDCRY